MNEDRVRKWVFVSLAVLFAAQLYFVRELFAALFLFAATFVAVAVIAALIYVVHEGGQRAIAWAETQWKLELPWKAVFAGSRRVLALATAFSKKPSPRPHSTPAP